MIHFYYFEYKLMTLITSIKHLFTYDKTLHYTLHEAQIINTLYGYDMDTNPQITPIHITYDYLIPLHTSHGLNPRLLIFLYYDLRNLYLFLAFYTLLFITSTRLCTQKLA